MKHRNIKLSISSIIAMMIFVISPVTIAETQLDMLDTSANQTLLSDDNLIYTHRRGYRHRHHRRYHRHHRRYHRHPRYRRYYRDRYNRRYYRDRYNRRHYYDNDRYYY
jgi:hypothetical protein